jgi:hypothetical protein
MAKTIIKHIQGNQITIAFPIMEREKELTDGSLVGTDTENAIQGDVWVILSMGLMVRQYRASVRGNYIVITDHGHLPVGRYDIDVRFDVTIGGITYPMRYYENDILHVVNATQDGEVYESTDYDVLAYYPVIHGRASAVVIGDGYVRLYAGNGLNADIDSDSVNLRAGYGNSQVEVTENNVNININE